MKMIVRCRWCLVLVAVSWMATSAAAEVKLPHVFGSHMVLQREKPVPVWGWAEAGEKISITLGEQTVETEADSDGKWKASLKPLEAGGPHKLVVKGTNTITLSDVLVGEVWICSGQSNMEWSVSRSANAKEEITAADHPQIRHIKIARSTPSEPQEDCDGTGWTVCSPETVAGYTAVGYFFGRHLQQELDVPIGLINTSWGGTICEAWTSQEALAGEPDFEEILQRGAAGKSGPNRASVLYNGMISPLIPFAFRGAIWYQGESNVGRAFQYGKLFPTMIGDWRKRWGEDFPFLFVQLAPFRYGRHDPVFCAELWDAQLKTLSLKNTGMAVTTDITTLKNIHPPNKQDVGKRLALWALGTTYGKDLVYSGPLYKSAKVEGDKIRISFDHVGGGLTTRDGKPLGEFTIAGEDQKFVPATATIEGDEVVVTSSEVAKPVAVRFAYHDTAQPNLMNKEGLPASPFRTDDFKAATADNK